MLADVLLERMVDGWMDEWAAALVLDRLGGQLDRKDEFIFF